MTQPPASGRDPGAEPGRDPGLPGGAPGLRGAVPQAGRPARERALQLGDFSTGGAGDTRPPGPRLAAALDRVSGPDRRCGPATDDELTGVLSRWAALESWAAAAKLAVLAELVRRRAKPGHEKRAAGDLPDAWDQATGHEVAAALALSLPGADKLTDLAWTLGARLPGIAAKLADGTIDALKASIVCRELAVLDDAQAAQAEALILGELAGKTPGTIGRLAAQAACTVDPAGTARRRERAEREEARVRFWRANSGACVLAASGLPTDAALSANANIAARARQYKKANASPDATMDQLRVLAFLDILNGVTAEVRIARARADQAQADTGAAQPGGATRDDGRRDDRPGDDHRSDDGSRDGQPAEDSPSDHHGLDDRCGDEWPGDDDWSAADDWPTDDDPPADYLPADDDRPADYWPADDWPGDSDSDAAGESPGSPSDGAGAGLPGAAPAAGGAGPELAATINLTIPLGTVLGQEQRPGQGHGLGPIDPELARDLAAAAARSRHSRWCITVTSPDGIAIGHGCARPARTRKGKPPPPRDGPPAFTSRDDPGPPGGYGTWTLTLPGGQELDVSIMPVPVTDCDHRYESHGYQPSDLLRHLVQIRDGQCTFPCCSRHARESDFEHAIPYDQGGRTCACNAGARSRRCHKVKQSKGWSVTQPLPGWHQWKTPSGRTYTQGPMKYPT